MKKSERAENIKKIIHIVVWITFVFYCLILLKLLFLDMRTQTSYANILHHINLIPFKTIYGYAVKIINDQINTDIVVRNILGNLIAFFPMGCYLPCLFPKIRKFKRVCFVMLGMLVGVELLQLLLRLGSFDIDDIIFNFGGAIVGYGIVCIPVINGLLKKFFVYRSSETLT